MAIVTGANRGIGAAIAVELARLGAGVLVGYLRTGPDAPGPDAVLAEVRAQGRRAVALEADLRVADPADVARVVGWLCTAEARLVTGNRIRLR